MRSKLITSLVCLSTICSLITPSLHAATETPRQQLERELNFLDVQFTRGHATFGTKMQIVGMLMAGTGLAVAGVTPVTATAFRWFDPKGAATVIEFLETSQLNAEAAVAIGGAALATFGVVMTLVERYARKPNATDPEPVSNEMTEFFRLPRERQVELAEADPGLRQFILGLAAYIRAGRPHADVFYRRG